MSLPALTQVVSAAIFEGDKILLIKRGNNPHKGKWSFPGGRVEVGESNLKAIKREILEETGLSIDIFHPVHSIDFEEHNYCLNVFVALGDINDAMAMDDAEEATVFSLSEVEKLSLTPNLMQSIVAARETLEANL